MADAFEGSKLADEFISLGCLCYDDPHYDHRSFHTQARDMLVRHPELAALNIWTAAAAGNAEAVRRFVAADRGLANRGGGPYNWPPLICACYSRVEPPDPSHSTLEAARVLLDAGADAKAFLLKQNDPPGSGEGRKFTALTGVFGGGSTGLANQPPHPRWRELAELLLERGADPNDDQALHINPDASLEILLRHGLDSPDLLARELARAARQGNLKRVRLLLGHGTPLGEPVEGRTPWQHAMDRGHHEIAHVLEAAGAPVSPLSEVEEFVSWCLAGDRAAAQAMLSREPELRERAPQDMVRRAVESGRPEAVHLVIDAGFDPNWQDDNAALHCAAGRGDEAMARLLLARGASLTLRDPWYDSTAVGWAHFFDRKDLRDKLLSEGPICIFDALEYGRLDRMDDILARDPESINRPFARCASRGEPKPGDWQAPLARVVDRGDTEAVRALLTRGADAGVLNPDGRSLLQMARESGHAEIERLLATAP